MAYQAHPEVRRYMPGAPHDEARAIRFLTSLAQAQGDERGRYHAYAVEHLADRRVIGDVGVYLQKEPADEGDLGFQFHPDYHGQGYAFEAASKFLDYLFRNLKLRRVTAGCDAQNTASARLIGRLGLHPTESSGEGLAFALTRDRWSL